ncbi:MAG: hypothetical protein HY662_04645 [Chloroflexi bacterium]|nr:hypothetical protein [Chloroflexota bacterium]
MAFSDPGKGRVILDSGSGVEPGKVTLAEDCKCGDVLGYSSGWKRALATVGSVVQGRLVALAEGKNGDDVPVSDSPVVGGYAGATPGGYVYVDEGTNNGQVTQTAPSTSGDANTIIGLALSATTVLFFLNSRPDGTA